MILERFLTEFDDRISGELNVDPLGLQVIWSAFGQKIFRNRISSISNDVRSYTLNLFNHWVIRAVVEDDTIVLGKGPGRVYASKQVIEFKQACLIYIENLFAYSMISAQSQDDVQTGGVLGISKARRRWEASDGNPSLTFSHSPKAHVLVRQLLLGVSGRYKTPLLQMGFFDSRYDYALPGAQPLWQKAGQVLIHRHAPLKQLHVLLRQHLSEVVGDDKAEPQRTFDQVPDVLKRAFVRAFRSPTAVGDYAGEFWLAVTELDQGAPGALYRVLRQEDSEAGDPQSDAAVVFALALRQPGLAEAERARLEHVMQLEPFLGELDLLFAVMVSEKSQALAAVAEKWTALGRSAETLSRLAAPLLANPALLGQVTGTGSERLNALLAVAREPDFREQVRRLFTYHADVMDRRGQSPWLRLLNQQHLKLDVRARVLPSTAERPEGSWVNQYYIPQFRHLLSGLNGGGV